MKVHKTATQTFDKRRIENSYSIWTARGHIQTLLINHIFKREKDKKSKEKRKNN